MLKDMHVRMLISDALRRTSSVCQFIDDPISVTISYSYNGNNSINGNIRESSMQTYKAYEQNYAYQNITYLTIPLVTRQDNNHHSDTCVWSVWHLVLPEWLMQDVAAISMCSI